VLHYLWIFLNSNIGMELVAGCFLTVLGWVFTKIPKAEKFFELYKAPLFHVVREVERLIPDDTPNKAMKRADAALKLLLQVAPELQKQSETTLRTMLNKAHEEAEKKDIARGGSGAP
jgi:hypothetical protein